MPLSEGLTCRLRLPGPREKAARPEGRGRGRGSAEAQPLRLSESKMAAPAREGADRSAREGRAPGDALPPLPSRRCFAEPPPAPSCPLVPAMLGARGELMTQPVETPAPTPQFSFPPPPPKKKKVRWVGNISHQGCESPNGKPIGHEPADVCKATGFPSFHTCIQARGMAECCSGHHSGDPRHPHRHQGTSTGPSVREEGRFSGKQIKKQVVSQFTYTVESIHNTSSIPCLGPLCNIHGLKQMKVNLIPA